MQPETCETCSPGPQTQQDVARELSIERQLWRTVCEVMDGALAN